MVRSSENSLIARDTALPGLGFALDTGRVFEYIAAACPEARLTGIERRYIRYKPSTNCLVAFRAFRDDQVYDFYVKTFAQHSLASVKKLQRRAAKSSGIGFGRLFDRSLNGHISAFPNDSRLRALRRFGKSRRVGRFLKEVQPASFDGGPQNYETQTYKPERRYACRISIEKEQGWLLKLHTAADYRRSLARLSQLAPDVLRFMPPVRFLNDEFLLIAVEWQPGETIRDRIARGVQCDDNFFAVGDLLASLHRLPIDPDIQGTTSDDIVSRCASQARYAAWLLPSLGARVDYILQKIVAASQTVQISRAYVHGDLHSKQVVVQGDSIALIDFDELKIGEPLSDLGLFIAHLERDQLRGLLSDTELFKSVLALTSGYGLSPDATSQLNFFTAVGLLSLLHHPFRAGEPGWAESIAAILGRTEYYIDLYLAESSAGARLARPLKGIGAC